MNERNREGRNGNLRNKKIGEDFLKKISLPKRPSELLISPSYSNINNIQIYKI